MSQSNSNQPVVTSFGPNHEIFVHRGGLLSVATAIRRTLTVAKSVNEAALASEGRSFIGTYSKDYPLAYQSPNFVRHGEHLEQAWGNIENEIAVLWLCSSLEHIVDLRAVYQANPAVLPALTLRYVPGISLQEMLCRQPNISEQQVKMCIRDLLRALRSLHSLGIAHLDLRPPKVLLLGGRFGEGVKLCGFRFARMLYEEVFAVRDTMVTTIDVDFMAPEVIQGMAVSYATDIWSVGVIAFVMLMRHLPFSPTNDTHTLANTSENPVTLAMAFADRLRQRMSPQALDFIRRCTILWVPSDRLTVEQCLAHPWLADAPDPLWMLRTLADVCATASPASANQPRSSPEQERRPVAALDLRMRAATGERDRVRPRPLQHDAEPITPTDQMSVARDTASTRTSTSSTF